MTKPMKTVVFDAHAILKWLQKESGYRKVKKFILACNEKSLVGHMCQINVGEVYYKVIRLVGLDEARKFLEEFSLLPINLVLPDSDLIWKAAEIKAQHAISYPDCFVAATALRFGATILTGDPEFKKIKNIVRVEWI